MEFPVGKRPFGPQLAVMNKVRADVCTCGLPLSKHTLCASSVVARCYARFTMAKTRCWKVPRALARRLRCCAPCSLGNCSTSSAGAASVAVSSPALQSLAPAMDLVCMPAQLQSLARVQAEERVPVVRYSARRRKWKPLKLASAANAK